MSHEPFYQEIADVAQELSTRFPSGWRFTQLSDQKNPFRIFIDSTLQNRDDAIQTMRSVFRDTTLLDSRLGEAIAWGKTQEGYFPDLLIRSAHLNEVYDWSEIKMWELKHDAYPDTPYRIDLPATLNEQAAILKAQNFKFYCINRIDKSCGSRYHYEETGPVFVDDVIKTMNAAAQVLDLSYGYLSKLYANNPIQ